MLEEKAGDGMGWKMRGWKDRRAEGQLLALGQLPAAPP